MATVRMTITIQFNPSTSIDHFIETIKKIGSDKVAIMRDARQSTVIVAIKCPRGFADILGEGIKLAPTLEFDRTELTWMFIATYLTERCYHGDFERADVVIHTSLPADFWFVTYPLTPTSKYPHVDVKWIQSDTNVADITSDLRAISLIASDSRAYIEVSPDFFYSVPDRLKATPSDPLDRVGLFRMCLLRAFQHGFSGSPRVMLLWNDQVEGGDDK